MASIGSWWVSSVEARPNEAVQRSFYANRLRRSERPLGGKLYISDRRLVFCPHLFDSLLGGAAVTFDHDTIDSVQTVQPGTGDDDPYGAGDTERLELTVDSGETTQFVLETPKQAVEATLAAIQTRHRDQQESDDAGHL